MTIKDQDTSKQLSQESKESSDSKQNREIIDDAFYVEEAKYKIWHSFNVEGKPLITSLSKEQCISATRFYLKGCQEGWQETDQKYDSIVGGKL